MSTLVNTLSALTAAAGVLVGLAIAARTGEVRSALRAALEMWTAAGALHLAADSAWSAIGSAASILVIRKLLTVGLNGSRVRRKRRPPTG